MYYIGQFYIVSMCLVLKIPVSIVIIISMSIFQTCNTKDDITLKNTLFGKLQGEWKNVILNEGNSGSINFVQDSCYRIWKSARREVYCGDIPHTVNILTTTTIQCYVQYISYNEIFLSECIARKSNSCDDTKSESPSPSRATSVTFTEDDSKIYLHLDFGTYYRRK